jgi:hypothetical protein
MLWLSEHIRYLSELQKTAEDLSAEYMKLYNKTQGQLYKIKLPSIILSSCAGFASFGSSNFGSENSQQVTIAVGITGLLVAILNSIESFFGIQNTATNSKATSLVLNLLAQRISLELSLPDKDRSAEGIVYTRTSFNEFLTTIEKAPPITYRKVCEDKIRRMAKNLSEASLPLSSRDPSPISPISARVIHIQEHS